MQGSPLGQSLCTGVFHNRNLKWNIPPCRQAASKVGRYVNHHFKLCLGTNLHLSNFNVSDDPCKLKFCTGSSMDTFCIHKLILKHEIHENCNLDIENSVFPPKCMWVVDEKACMVHWRKKKVTHNTCNYSAHLMLCIQKLVPEYNVYHRK